MAEMSTTRATSWGEEEGRRPKKKKRSLPLCNTALLRQADGVRNATLTDGKKKNDNGNNCGSAHCQSDPSVFL